MIIHVDMDAFYASIEIRDRPELAGRPVVVGGTPEGRGVVAAASYEARKFGVHSAMPAITARRLCPQAVFLPSRMENYARVSRSIREIFHRYTPLVEPLALDEAFLDASGSERLFGSSIEIARQIKDEIRGDLRLVASVGVAPNKFLAKIASDLEKPDGFVVVQPGAEQQFLDPLPVERLWGVGRQAAKAFHKLGVTTIGTLRQMPLATLDERFGKNGQHLWQLARGIDNRAVVPDRQAKSISHETTFAADIEDREALRAWLLELTEQVSRRLRRHQLQARTVQLKIRFSDFHTITRAQTLREPTSATDELWQSAATILTDNLPTPRPVRLLGMGVSGMQLHGARQQLLFDEAQHEKRSRIDAVVDELQDRYGTSALKRAGGRRAAGD